MKRIIFIMVMMLFVQGIHAQQYYGQVQDRDGYTNIRRGPGTNYAIVRRYQSGDYLYYTPQNNGWSKVYSGKSSNTYMGYMHTSRIVQVNPNNSSNSSFSSSTSFKYGQHLRCINDNTIYLRTGPGENYRIGFCYLGYWENNGKFERDLDSGENKFFEDHYLDIEDHHFMEFENGDQVISFGDSKNGYTLVYAEVFCDGCQHAVGWFPTKYLRKECSKCNGLGNAYNQRSGVHDATCPKCGGRGYIK